VRLLSFILNELCSRFVITSHAILIKDEVLLTVSCPIFPSIFIAKNLLTGSLRNRSIDNLETQKKSISSIGGVMVSVRALSVVDRGFESRSDQTKEYTLDICRFY
jgi:hypothetical protein